MSVCLVMCELTGVCVFVCVMAEGTACKIFLLVRMFGFYTHLFLVFISCARALTFPPMASPFLPSGLFSPP